MTGRAIDFNPGPAASVTAAIRAFDAVLDLWVIRLGPPA